MTQDGAHEEEVEDSRDRLIVALDFPSAQPALDLVARLGDAVRWYKVGLELYLAAGPSVVSRLRERGLSVFLDLKLHDIPNTVAGAVRALAGSGASLLTVHAAGGGAMLRAAAEAAETAGAPRLLAVTVLTSMDQAQLAGVGLDSSPAEQVLRLAKLATAAGIDGLVCSAQELVLLRRELGSRATLVVPGIRPAELAAGDQMRVATPAQAMRAGASMLVVGRPITQAEDPAEAVRALLHEMKMEL